MKYLNGKTFDPWMYFNLYRQITNYWKFKWGIASPLLVFVYKMYTHS